MVVLIGTIAFVTYKSTSVPLANQPETAMDTEEDHLAKNRCKRLDCQECVDGGCTWCEGCFKPDSNKAKNCPASKCGSKTKAGCKKFCNNIHNECTRRSGCQGCIEESDLSKSVTYRCEWCKTTNKCDRRGHYAKVNCRAKNCIGRSRKSNCAAAECGAGWFADFLE